MSDAVFTSLTIVVPTGEEPDRAELDMLTVSAGVVIVDLALVYQRVGAPGDAVVEWSLDQVNWQAVPGGAVELSVSSTALGHAGFLPDRPNYYRATVSVGTETVGVYSDRINPGATQAEFVTYTDGTGYVAVDLSRLEQEA